MKRNCDNCKKQNKKKLLQDCNSEGYPLYEECKNWESKTSKTCLSCANSFSEPGGDTGDILHCVEHNDKVVRCDYSCEDYN